MAESPEEVYLHRIIDDGEKYLKGYYEPCPLDRVGTKYHHDDVVKKLRRALRKVGLATTRDNIPNKIAKQALSSD